MSQPLLTDPNQIFVFLILVIGLVYWISSRAKLAPFFRFLTPVLWIYFLPMLATTFGILPAASPVYGWIRDHLLPAALILLLLSANLPTIARLGGKALFTMLAGTGLGARYGLVIRDCAQNVNQNEADGITRKVTKEKAEQFEKEYGKD